VLPGYQGILIRDGYPGYDHLTGALNAWCGAHLLRDLKDVHDASPDQQEWAGKMGCLLLWAPRSGARRPPRRQDRHRLAVLRDLFRGHPWIPRARAVRITTRHPRHTAPRHTVPVSLAE
jgi:transposase